MKRILSLSVLSVLFTVATMAQITGGGSPSTGSSKKSSDGILDNHGYWTFSIAKAAGDYAEYPTFSSPNRLGGQMGFASDLGMVIYFSSLPLPSNMAAGLDISGGTSLMVLDWNDDNAGINFMLGGALGPVFSYGLSENAAIDVYAKLQMTAAAMAYSGASDVAGSSVFSNLKKNIGANFRYGNFILGLGWELGDLDYTVEIVDTNTEFDHTYNTNMTKITIGFAF
jgi:hypothetical protein